MNGKKFLLMIVNPYLFPIDYRFPLPFQPAKVRKIVHILASISEKKILFFHRIIIITPSKILTQF